MNILEQIIGFVSPKTAFQRQNYRLMSSVVQDRLRKYEAASNGRRTEGWHATGNSATVEIAQALPYLRARARQLVRDNPYAKKSVRVIANNTVGIGIRPSPKQSGNKKSDQKIKKLWTDWAGKKQCDFDNLHNFYGLEKLIMKAVVESGEAIVRRRRVKSKTIPLQLQVVEGDFIDTSRNISDAGNGSFIIEGIEFSREGKRVAYWLFDRHPGDQFKIATDIVSKRIPVEELAHIYYVDRPGQIRGVPFIVTSMLRMKDFDEYEDAQLIRQKIAACYAVFVRDQNVNPDTLPGMKTDKNGDLTERVEPGMIQHLPGGKDITFATPPNAEGYDTYAKTMLQSIAAGSSITYESMTGDYSNVNFSSGRMGWLEMARDVEDWQQNMLIPMLCETVWEWFIEAAKLTGITNRDVETDWTVPRREMLDPVKETKAKIDQIRAGLKSMPEALREDGYEPEDILNETKEWQDRLDDLEIVFDTDARNDIKEPATDGQGQNPAAEGGAKKKTSAKK